MRVHVDVIYSSRVECTGSSDDPVHFVPFSEQQLSQVRTIFAGSPLPGRVGNRA